jgi:hypothetical protein
MIPSAHTFPCPYCSIPLDAGDEDNWESGAICCHNCKKYNHGIFVMEILRQKDGQSRFFHVSGNRIRYSSERRERREMLNDTRRTHT